MIGSLKPHCFRDVPCPIPYTNQSIDRGVYSHWWLNIFLPAVREFTTEPVALTMDHCLGQFLTLEDPFDQVKVFLLPPNCPSVLDQGISFNTFQQRKYNDGKLVSSCIGITGSVKVRYKKEMIRKLVEALSAGDAEELAAAKVAGGRKGLRHGCPATVLEAARLIKHCWESMAPSETANSFRHARCIPNSAQKDLPPSPDAQQDPSQALVEFEQVFT